MPWSEVFIVFFVSHLAGDFVLQTEWQAMNKHGGLGRDREKRRALASHIVSYTLAYTPALIWLSGETGVTAIALTVAAIALPHAVQDDARLLKAYTRKVKKTDAGPSPLYTWIDFSFHIITLFVIAAVVGT